MVSEHTSLPWHLKIYRNLTPPIIEVHRNGKKLIAWPGFDGIDLPPSELIANAEFIVRAVNAHDDLLAAASETLDFFLDAMSAVENAPHCLLRLEAAIAKATTTSAAMRQE